MIETIRHDVSPARRRFRLAGFGAAIAALLFLSPLLAACGGAYGGGSSGGSGGPTLSITEPANGASVTVPFMVKVTSSEQLGTTESGKHHVHLYFDDNQNDYTVVESDTAKITNAPTGRHVLHVSLRNANHSAAGAEAQVELTIGGAGGQTSPSPGASTSSDSEPGYHY
jgi:hypothetical protein